MPTRLLVSSRKFELVEIADALPRRRFLVGAERAAHDGDLPAAGVLLPASLAEDAGSPVVQFELWSADRAGEREAVLAWLADATPEEVKARLGDRAGDAVVVGADGRVSPLDGRVVGARWMRALPAVVVDRQAMIADNSDRPLTMGALLKGFVRQFSTVEHSNTQVDLVTGYLYADGLRHVLKLLDNHRIEKLRLLFSGRSDRRTARALTTELVHELDYSFGANEEDRALWERCRAAAESERLQVRVYTRAFLHAKLFMGWSGYDDLKLPLHPTAVLGSSNVTRPGMDHLGNLELNLAVQDRKQVDHLINWYDARWSEAAEPDPLLLEALERARPSTEPVFETAGLVDLWRAGAGGRLGPGADYLAWLCGHYGARLDYADRLGNVEPFPEAAGRKLIPSPEQVHGVQSLMNKLLNYRVAFLADSVGLGKTVTALGTAWLATRSFGIQNPTLIAPRKLHVQWKHDTHLLKMPEKRLRYRNRHKLEQAGADERRRMLAGSDLLIVDEAHEALRNRSNQLWQAIREHLRDNPGCLLLLISATPWNNSREDIFSYLALAWADGPGLSQQFHGLSEPEVRHVVRLCAGGGTASAARTFGQLTPPRYKPVFDRAFIQRTRRAVVEREGSPGITQGFPRRRLHASESPSSPEVEAFIRTVGERLPELSLPQYDPIGALTRAISRTERSEGGASTSLYGGLITLLFKRAESSLFALATSLVRMDHRLRRLDDQLEAIAANPSPREALAVWLTARSDELSASMAEEGEGDLDDLDLSRSDKRQLKALRELMSQVDDEGARQAVTWLREHEVQRDRATIASLLEQLTAELDRRDPKANRLVEIIESHVTERRKVLAIAGYADTAVRMFLRLVERFPGSSIGLALGQNDGYVYRPNQCAHLPLSDEEWRTVVGLQPDPRLRALLIEAERVRTHSRGHILDLFAPRARGQVGLAGGLGGEIDILVGSEAIGVGQNLQDASVLVHLDLPWNPMVIEQRIGRVDRRGGGRVDPEDPDGPRIADVHYCWSPVVIEEAVTLRDRLRKKMKGALEDTHFDELVLVEVYDTMVAARENREASVTHALDRQSARVDDATRLPGATDMVGAEADGLRLLASWRTRHGGREPPASVVATGIRSGDPPALLVSAEVMPHDAQGQPLTGAAETLHLVVGEAERPSSDYASDLELVVRRLEHAEAPLSRPEERRAQWTQRLRRVDRILQSVARQRVQQQNAFLTEQLERSRAARDGLKPIKEAFYRATTSYQAALKAFSQKHPRAAELLEEHKAGVARLHALLKSADAWRYAGEPWVVVEPILERVINDSWGLFESGPGDVLAALEPYASGDPGPELIQSDLDRQWAGATVRLLAACVVGSMEEVAP